MRFRFGLGILGIFLTMTALQVSAQEAPANEEGATVKHSLFQKETEPRSYMSFQPFYSLYYFNDRKPFEDVFKHGNVQPFGITIGTYPVKNLGINLNVAYASQKGHAVGETSGAASGEKVTLTLVPVQLEAVYRFDFVDEQFIVPLVGAGGDWWYYKEDNEFAKDVEGGKTGWHATAGVGILLDKIDPSTRHLLREYSIENVFLEIEARWAFMSHDNNGLDFSGSGYSAGLLFEF